MMDCKIIMILFKYQYPKKGIFQNPTVKPDRLANLILHLRKKINLNNNKISKQKNTTRFIPVSYNDHPSSS